MWEGGRVITEPIQTQHQPAGGLTAVSCNSGWGFGAVELYSWWNNGGRWTWTQTLTPNKVGDRILQEHSRQKGGKQ